MRVFFSPEAYKDLVVKGFVSRNKSEKLLFHTKKQAYLIEALFRSRGNKPFVCHKTRKLAWDTTQPTN